MTNDTTPQALTGSDLSNLFKLLYRHKVAKKYWTKLPVLIGWSLLLAPLYWLEKILLLIMPSVPIHPEPIFIIGHWRSGTTYLHYLLAKDKQFGYCSNADAFAPGALLIGRWLTRKVIAWRLPKTRPMDNVKLHVDAPQEEEFAMMLLTPNSAYHGFVFPSELKKMFFTFTLFNTDNVSLINLWRNQYYQFLRKLSYGKKGKRLLLKNPANTTRIKQLTSMFPKARFIYLYRNAEHVKQSTLRMYKALININSLQSFDETALRQQVEILHKAFIKEYENQRSFINPEKIIEIAYDDLIAHPLQTIRRIYETLDIPAFELNKPAFENFIHEQASYKPHQYSHIPG